MEEGITPNDHPPSCVFLCAQMDISMDISMDIHMDIHMWMSIDTHMDMSMDIHMEMPIKSMVSKLDGLYIQSEPAASRALRRWSNNPSAEGLIINDP
ncbi:restriction endonuclease EcoRII [Bifidobacterium longum subsp. longum]|nr:restriction endonuclease EcoRII [Bifidobacterium longum subsp. longum]